MVEFALVAPLALFLLYVVFEMGRAGYDYNFVASGAREGARAAVAAQESSKSAADVQTDVVSAVKRGLGGGIAVDSTVHAYTGVACPNSTLGMATIYMSPSGSTAPGGSANPYVTVEVCYTYQPWVDLVARVVGNHLTLDSKTVMKTEY